MATKIITVSDLKAKLPAVLSQADTSGTPVYVTVHGKPRAVLVPYEEYEALLEKLDDLEDILAMEDALKRPEREAITLSQYERRRRAQVRG